MLPHIQRILDALKDWKQTGDNQWAARCPAHDDKTASCSVGIGKDDRALIWCHAGCNQDVVLKAMGMTYKDLFPDGDKQAEKIVATYQYRDANGNWNPTTIETTPSVVPSVGVGFKIVLVGALSLKAGIDASTSNALSVQPVEIDYAGRAGLSWMFQ